jgi:hypothetical protein
MCWILAVLALGELGGRYLWEIRISEGDAIQVCSLSSRRILLRDPLALGIFQR